MTSTLSRRRFLGSTLAAGAAVGLSPRIAFASPTDPMAGDTIVYVFLRGAHDGLSMVVPYGDSRYYDIRPNIAVPTPNVVDRLQGALPLVPGFGLHPGMAALYDGPWAQGKMAIVHATGLTNNSNRSHFEAMRFWEAGGHDVTQAAGGWLSRYLTAVGATGTIPGIGRGANLQYSLRGHPEAIAIADVNSFGLQDFPSTYRNGARNALATFYPNGAPDLLGLTSNHALDIYNQVQAANPTAVPPSVAYPSGNTGNAFIQTAQLLKAGLGIRAVAIDFGSWDYHEELGTIAAGPMRNAVTSLSNTLAAFVADLGALMNEITIVVVSEFGRTIDENGSRGTDHGWGNCALVIGGNVVGGMHAVDRFPGVVQAPSRGDLAVTTDIRSILCEILRKRCEPGLDLGAVFPTWSHDTSAELGIVV